MDRLGNCIMEEEEGKREKKEKGKESRVNLNAMEINGWAKAKNFFEI